MAELSHVSEAGDVRMVDVGGKPLSRRRAVARGRVELAPETARRLRELPKGDALVTAQLAGVMAAKRTSELIPLCHPLPLTKVEVEITPDRALPGLLVRATTKVTGRTGVEMEALTGAAVAALTIYDMCKGLSHDIEIRGLRLMAKAGGRRTFKRRARATTRATA